jgi:transcriptional regulator with XRE-family HTH domain
MGDDDTRAFMREVGARLRAARQAKGLSLRDVASRFDISHGAIGHWETGHNPIDLATLHKLARLYHVSVLSLVADKISDEEAMALLQRQLSQARQGMPDEAPRKRPGRAA